MVMKKFTESALFKFGGIAGWFYLIIFAAEFLFIIPLFLIAEMILFYNDPSKGFDPFHLFYLIDSVLLNAGLAAGLLLLARHLYFQPKEHINKSRKRSIIKIIILSAGFIGFIFYIICTCAVIVIDFNALNSII